MKSRRLVLLMIGLLGSEVSVHAQVQRASSGYVRYNFTEALQNMGKDLGLFPLFDRDLASINPADPYWNEVAASFEFHLDSNNQLTLSVYGSSPAVEGQKIRINGKLMTSENYRELRILKPGTVVEVPELKFKYTVPAAIPEAAKNPSIYARYSIDRRVNHEASKAYANPGRNRVFPNDNGSYFELARELGWNPDQPASSHIDVTRLEELYKKRYGPLLASGKLKPEQVLKPGLILIDEAKQQYVILEAWRPIPKHLKIPNDGFISDTVERILNAHGFFTMDSGRIATHDLLGHLGSYWKNPEIGAGVSDASRGFLPKQMPGVTHLPEQGMLLIGEEAMSIPYTIDMRRFSVFSEFGTGLRNQADRGEWEKLRTTATLKGKDPVAEMNRALFNKERADPGYMAKQAKRLHKFYTEKMTLPGGLARDEGLLGDLAVTAIEDIADGTRTRRMLREAPLQALMAALSDENIIKNPNTLRELLASAELQMDFWTSETPVDFMRGLSGQAPEVRARMLAKARDTGLNVSVGEETEGRWYWFEERNGPLHGDLEHRHWKKWMFQQSKEGESYAIRGMLEKGHEGGNLTPEFWKQFAHTLENWRLHPKKRPLPGDFIDLIDEIEKYDPPLSFRTKFKGTLRQVLSQTCKDSNCYEQANVEKLKAWLPDVEDLLASGLRKSAGNQDPYFFKQKASQISKFPPESPIRRAYLEALGNMSPTGLSANSLLDIVDHLPEARPIVEQIELSKLDSLIGDSDLWFEVTAGFSGSLKTTDENLLARRNFFLKALKAQQIEAWRMESVLEVAHKNGVLDEELFEAFQSAWKPESVLDKFPNAARWRETAKRNTRVMQLGITSVLGPANGIKIPPPTDFCAGTYSKVLEAATAGR